MAPLTASSAAFILLVTAAGSVNAAVALWGQCGGIGYGGETTCVSGAYCKYTNDYYSQCVPGTATTTPVVTPTVGPTTTTSNTQSTPTVIPGQNIGGNVYTACTKPKTVALTFDDGPYLYTQEISNTLIANGAKGTFFVNGKTPFGKCIYEDNGSRVKFLYDKGHQIASHLWSHPHANTLSSSALTTEMDKIEQAIKRITGATPAFIRPPYGEYNDQFRNLAKPRNQALVTWDFDAGDWDSAVTPAATKQRYLTKVNGNPNNFLTLNHETYASTANDVLPYVVSLLKSKGYAMVTVAECLGLQPYTAIGSPSSPDGSWVC